MQFQEAANKFNIVVFELEKIKTECDEYIEGGSQGEQSEQFIRFLHENPKINRVLEIGFNLGHSAATFLSASPEIKVISVDLGEHKYIHDCKKVIDKHFPGRHQLFIGDSTKLIPQLKGKIHPNFIFIDGGHFGDTPLQDIRNCLAISDNNTILCLDDTEYLYGWYDVVTALCTVLKSNEVSLESLRVHRINGAGWTYFKKTPQ
uniref:Methyltransferase n=1 Tax=viral metagenome TaxID=1070528 RepID=A0A6C0BID1_9ZZZZ